MPTTKLSFIMPGTGGINTDDQPWSIEPNQVRVLINGITHNGVVTQRRGWQYHVAASVTDSDSDHDMDSYSEHYFPSTQRIGSVATQKTSLWSLDESDNQSVWRKIAAPTKEFLQGKNVPLPKTKVSGMSVTTPDISTKRTPRYIPRVFYNGEILFCATDGYYPVLRYCGGYQNQSSAFEFTDPTNGLGNVFDDGGSYANLLNNGQTFVGGQYWMPRTNGCAHPSWRITRKDATSANRYPLESGFVANAQTSTPVIHWTSLFGVAWAAQEITSEGKVSIAKSTGAITYSVGEHPDKLLMTQTDAPYPWMHDCIHVEKVAGLEWVQAPLVQKAVTSAGLFPSGVTNANYSITRRLGFRDIAAHNSSLWGAGSVTNPSRVWYTESNWNLALPPELGAPNWNYGTDPFINRRSGRMRYVDVPGENTDEIIAILSTDSPLLVLKNNTVHGIYGAFPNYTQNLLSSGTGCLDVRGAISVDGYGAYWAGPNGIYSYRKGKITNITSKKVNTEWKRRIKGYRTDKDTDNVIALGISNDHLIVSCSVGATGAKDEWVWTYNLATGAWAEMTNMGARYFWNVVTNAGIEATLATLTGGNVDRRPVNIKTALDMSGDPADGNSVIPYMRVETGSTVDGDKTPSRDSRLTEVRLDTTLDDNEKTGTTVEVVVTASSGIDQVGKIEQSVGKMTSAADGFTHQKRFHAGLSGRDNRVRVTVTGVHADNRLIALNEIGVSVRSRRPEV